MVVLCSSTFGMFFVFSTYLLDAGVQKAQPCIHEQTCQNPSVEETYDISGFFACAVFLINHEVMLAFCYTGKLVVSTIFSLITCPKKEAPCTDDSYVKQFGIYFLYFILRLCC